MSDKSEKDSCSCSSSIDRRQFIKVTSASALLCSGADAIAGPFDKKDHFVPLDKKLSQDWINSLYATGGPTWFDGVELETIGMPIGGVCAGQVYLTGDGNLIFCDIFNSNINSGYGRVNYKTGRKAVTAVIKGREFTTYPEIEQGFAVRISSGDKTVTRELNCEDFPKVRFCGEYPVGHVNYIADDLPVEISLKAFSPFIPLNTNDSSLPATILRYSFHNSSKEDLKISVSGWLQNPVSWRTSLHKAGQRINSIVEGSGFMALKCEAEGNEASGAKERPPFLFADFEGTDYGGWKSEGKAFGAGPANGTLPSQQKVTGFEGKGLVNTYLGGNDRLVGKLTSPSFEINRKYISFLVGGGAHKDRTCMNLVVAGKTVKTATGKNNELLKPCNWKVDKFLGRRAHFEIIDDHKDGWGHINIDKIEFRDAPIPEITGKVEELSDYGTMALAVLQDKGDLNCTASLPEGERSLDHLFTDGNKKEAKQFPERLVGSLGVTKTVKPDETKRFDFLVCWHMPNMRRKDRLVGVNYSNRFNDAHDLVEYIAANMDRLHDETMLWRDTYYSSTLPYWLLDRIGSTVSILASATCQWWKNGRFWAYEGVGCCRGTCGHVWNYEHAMARLFPDLERSVRNMQDFADGVGFNSETGAIAFRGENYNMWAGDAQGGYILKAYREHLISSNDDFLKKNWKNIKKAMNFLIEQDQNSDGLIEGSQHQTYDQNYFGANTMVGSLYLGALLSAKKMAERLGDNDYAARCAKIFEKGKTLSSEKLFNGEYFIQDVDLKEHPHWQYGDGYSARDGLIRLRSDISIRKSKCWRH